MKLGSLKRGQHLALNNANFRIVRILEDDTFQLERLKDLALINRTRNDLLGALVNGDLSLIGGENHSPEKAQLPICVSDIASLSPVKQQLTMRRFNYVKAAEESLGETPRILGIEKVIAEVSHRLNDDSPPSVNTVYRWWRWWQRSGNNLKVLAPKVAKTRKHRRFIGIVSEEIFNVIEEVYLTPENNTIQAAYDQLCYRLNT